MNDNKQLTFTNKIYNFNDWLKLKCCDNHHWVNINNYPHKLKGKTFRIFDEQEREVVGKILYKNNKKHFIVELDGKIREMEEKKLRNSKCDIDINMMTNKDFCRISAMKYINFIKKKDDMYLNISEEQFIHNFSHLIYKNSQFRYK